MASAPERKVISNWLVTHLTTLDILVGKIIAPEGGGWATDPAKVSGEFIPYSVVTPQTGTPANPSIDDPSQDWNLSYVVTSYGVDADQVEDLSDPQRTLLLNTKKVPVAMSDSNWRITTIRCSSIGGVGYTTAVDPTAYSQSDSFILTLSRSLA